MISLRQHAISLAAVFLALAIGVVLGSGFLSDTLLSSLRDEKRDLYTQISGLNDQKNVLNEKLSAANNFDNQLVGRIVHDALGGKTVVVFRTPDAKDDDVAAVSKIVGQAGGAVTGTVSLTQEFVDANSAEKLRTVVNSSILPAGTQLSTKLVDQGSQAGDLLGIALLINHQPGHPGRSTTRSATPCWRRCATPASSPINPPTTSVRRTPPWSSPAARCPKTPATKASAWPGSPPRWPRTARAPCSPAGTVRRREAPPWR